MTKKSHKVTECYTPPPFMLAPGQVSFFNVACVGDKNWIKECSIRGAFLDANGKTVKQIRGTITRGKSKSFKLDHRDVGKKGLALIRLAALIEFRVFPPKRDQEPCVEPGATGDVSVHDPKTGCWAFPCGPLLPMSARGQGGKRPLQAKVCRCT